MTFAQDASSAQYADMPQHAVSSGAIDLILSPREIGARLGGWREDSLLNPTSNQRDDLTDEDQFPRVLAALRKSSGVDFSEYKESTLKRRTARRMTLRGVRTSAEYAQLLEGDRAEAAALFRDVLINVTSFFRDPDMFEQLKRDVFPEIASRGRADVPIRIWVPGCSTGQEAYSVAIALVEYLESAESQRTIQVFGTDLAGAESLEQARGGVYPESIEADVSADRLHRFFVKEQGAYRIKKQIREMCVFAPQNVAADPPFSRIDLVTCRNMLIYMSPALQDRLLPLFHFALNRGGFLVLGSAETIGSADDLFEVVNRTHKIYRHKEASRRGSLTFMSEEWLTGAPAPKPPLHGGPPIDFQREADRVLLNRYAPPGVLVNDQLEILHFRGRTSPFLEAPAGQPTMSVLRMAREGLFLELRSALDEAKAARAAVVREGLRVFEQGVELPFSLRVLPVTPPGSSNMLFLVLFETETPPWTAQIDPVAVSASDRDVEWLRRELSSSREYLQSVIDQQDAVTQELRAAHEEVLSSNEELKSTNEELETTKEELQSTNEELTTVNDQFLSRNRELDVLTDQLSNFISSADIPMVTVGRDLRIRRLTPAAERAFNLLMSDIGRSIDHIKFALTTDEIGPAIQEVIATLRPWEQEATDRDGRSWLLRVQPYRTGDDRIDGATIVAIDIDIIKRNQQLTEERDYARAIVQTVREPLAVLDADARVGTANAAFFALFSMTADALQGRVLWEADPAVWGQPALRQMFLDALSGTKPIADVEIERVLPNLGSRILVLNATPIIRQGRPTLLLLAVEDVTTTRAAEKLRVDAEALRQIDRRKDEFLGILAHELRNPLGPMRFAVDLLRSAVVPPEAGRDLLVIDRQLTHMVRLIDDLLDVSRIAHGKLELRKEELELSAVINSAVELCRPALESAHHELKMSVPAEPIRLVADPVRLTQVVVNVLNNAIKFTPNGGQIYLIVETSDASDRVAQVRIRVRDTGIGISPEVRPHIFDMFAQGDRSLERTRSGLGVGLTLVQKIVQLHAGSVDVRSAGTGAGTEVVIELPVLESAPVPDERGPARVKPSRALRILVADDSEDARDTMRSILERDGHVVRTAADGREAIEVAASFDPEVAILDIGMPGLSGLSVATELRKRRIRPPVLIAVSGLGQDEDKRRAKESGFDVHFTKPVDVHALTTHLARAAERRP